MSEAQRIAGDPHARECLWLVKNNVPFDVAFSLDDDTRKAWCVTFGEFEGATFDWHSQKWQEP